MTNVREVDVGDVFRREAGRCIATLIRLFGDISVAEEAVQEAFVVAAERWPQDGVPANPGGWICTTAKRRAIDGLRRESRRDQKEAAADDLLAFYEEEDKGPVDDDQLRLIFTCCHPALGREAQVALALRLICGLQVPEIARSFLLSESTMYQRITRAKRKIRAANIPYRVPSDDELPSRLGAVLAVVYLVYNEGYSSTTTVLVRDDLCESAIHLSRLLLELLPAEPEVWGLHALLLLLHSRRGARITKDNEALLLSEQDRALWDRDLIDKGQSLVRVCLRRNQPGPYQIQAAIQAVHCDATHPDETDWQQVVQLYDLLLRITPTPVVALNRAVAVAECDGPEVGLALINDLGLDTYGPFHAARGEFLARLGRASEAREAWNAAIRCTDNEVVKRLLGRRRDRRLLPEDSILPN